MAHISISIAFCDCTRNAWKTAMGCVGVAWGILSKSIFSGIVRKSDGIGVRVFEGSYTFCPSGEARV